MCLVKYCEIGYSSLVTIMKYGLSQFHYCWPLLLRRIAMIGSLFLVKMSIQYLVLISV